MRRYYDRDHLSTANRPQVFNRILLRQPHGASGRRHLYSDTMRTNGCTHPNNRSRPCILGTILSCQHKLRTHPQSDHTSGPSTSNGTSTNNHLVILSKPRKSGPPPASKSHGGTDDYFFTFPLVKLYTPNYRPWNFNHRGLFSIPFLNFTTRTSPRAHHKPCPYIHARTSFDLLTHVTPYSFNPKARADMRGPLM